ncbi:hypothetical protein EIP86_001673 [Pleurotus ostreatoroseus]|nr:hypothetical protein EIP86_001673 [Pleurotus ostreatoroseus]
MENPIQHRPSALAALDSEVASCMQRKADREAVYEQEVARLKQVLARDVEVIDSEISKLNRRRNALKPAGRLPPELLTMIFLTYLASYWPTHQTPDLASPFSEVTKRRAILLQVCQYWRAVVSQSAILWHWICPNGPEQLELALERSKPYPLSVFDCTISHPGAWVRLLEELPRMRTLHLCVNDDISQSLTSLDVSTLEAPILESLTLTARRPGSGNHLRSCELPIFPDLELPQLMSLTLLWMKPYEIGTLIRPTLTSLTLSVDSTNESLPTLLAALNAIPTLEALSIDHLSQWYDDEDHEEFEPITLPRLTSLSLYGDSWGSGDSVAWFLTLFSAPLKTLTQFKFIPRTGRTAHWEDAETACNEEYCAMTLVLPSLRRMSPMASDENKIQPRTLAWIDHNRLHPINRTDVRVSIWSAEMDFDKSSLFELQEARSRSFHGDVLWQANLFCGGDFIERPPVQEHMDLSLVTTLDIDTGIRGVAHWRKFFSTMPSVQTLIVRQMVSTKDYIKDVMLVLKDIFHAIALPPPSIGETQSLFPVLPALKTLCICFTDKVLISFRDVTPMLNTSSDYGFSMTDVVGDLRKSLCSRLAVFPRLHLLKFVDLKDEEYRAQSFAYARQVDVVEVNGKKYTCPVESREESLNNARLRLRKCGFHNDAVERMISDEWFSDY